MMNNRILPDLQTCLLCEEVRQELNGNFFLIGVLGVLTTFTLPVTALKLCLFTRWCCGVGNFRHRYQIVLPDDTSTLVRSEGEFHIRSVEDHLTQVTIFGNVQFQHAGTHWVEIFLEDELKLRFPFPVHLIPKPSSLVQPSC